MVDIKGQWQSVTDKGTWASRGATFAAKLKATKAVWFPPDASSTPASARKTAQKTAKKTTKKAARTTKKASRSRGTAKKAAGAAR